MIYQPLSANDKPAFPILRIRQKARAFYRERDDCPRVLDGSISALNRLLQELAVITGYADESAPLPMLELQLGDVLTTTSVSTERGRARLLITALLPRLLPSDYSPSPSEPMPSDAGDWELSWHADYGRYVLVHSVPIARISDERGMMDAILDTAEQAAAWIERIGARDREGRRRHHS